MSRAKETVLPNDLGNVGVTVIRIIFHLQFPSLPLESGWEKDILSKEMWFSLLRKWVS